MTETGIDLAVDMQVVAPDGTELGIVRSVDNGLAYIDPDPGLSDTLMARLGWGGADRHSYPLDSRKIDTITADHVRLQEIPEFVVD